jgi:hypothetical protein
VALSPHNAQAAAAGLSIKRLPGPPVRANCPDFRAARGPPDRGRCPAESLWAWELALNLYSTRWCHPLCRVGRRREAIVDGDIRASPPAPTALTPKGNRTARCVNLKLDVLPALGSSNRRTDVPLDSMPRAACPSGPLVQKYARITLRGCAMTTSLVERHQSRRGCGHCDQSPTIRRIPLAILEIS